MLLHKYGRINRKENEFMYFEQILPKLKAGYRVKRKGWKTQYIYYYVTKDELKFHVQPYIRVRDESGKYYPWTPNHNDILADDWEFCGVGCDDIAPSLQEKEQVEEYLVGTVVFQPSNTLLKTILNEE